MFNHVITTVELPSGRIWLDSTPGVAPFEYLLAAIRDQKALVVNTNGQAALVATPATAPYPFQERFEATGTLDAEGKLTAKMSATYHDDAEVLVRGLASSVAPAEWDKISQYISSAIGFSGTTSNSQFKNVQDASAPIAISYDYQKHPFGDWDNRRIIPLFPVLEFPALANDSAAPTDDIDLGAPRQLVAITHIQIPEHYRTDLPDPIHVKTEFASFDQTYQFDGKQITVERTVAILQEKVAKQEWKKYQRFLKDTSADSEPWIQLLAPVKPITIVEEQKPAADSKSSVISKEGKVTIVKVPTANSDTATKITPPPPAPVEDAPAAELMQKALEQMRTGDWTSAAGTLEAVKKKDAHQQFLWSALGTIAAMHRNFDEAKTDFRTELKNYPDNPMSVAGLADIEKHSGDSAAAQRTLKDYLNSHPDDLRLSMTLVSLQNEAGDYSAALKTLQTAADHHPEDQNVRVQLADTLFRLKQGEQAAAAAKSVLEDATDPLTMNNAAYVLAQTGHDLPFAETMSRKAVDLLEEKSAGITAAQANSNAFASGTLLVSAWDTLGWILYEEGKPEEALPLLQAAWRDSLRAEIGDHLGQTYEALKRNDNACAAYRLADAAANSSTPAEVRQHIHDAFTRLEKAGAKSGPLNGTQALQESRTYKLGHAEAVSGWGTFRIELSAEGVLEAQQMSGDRRIASVGDTIKKLKFSELIPPGSKAHLLRSAVVSCSQSSGCEVVLVPDGGLQTEQE